jgi:hypothetical protein
MTVVGARTSSYQGDMYRVVVVDDTPLLPHVMTDFGEAPPPPPVMATHVGVVAVRT